MLEIHGLYYHGTKWTSGTSFNINFVAVNHFSYFKNQKHKKLLDNLLTLLKFHRKCFIHFFRCFFLWQGNRSRYPSVRVAFCNTYIKLSDFRNTLIDFFRYLGAQYNHYKVSEHTHLWNKLVILNTTMLLTIGRKSMDGVNRPLAQCNGSFE